MNEFSEFIRERGITTLVHFTKTKNLPFILGNDPTMNSGIVANEFISDKSLLEKIDPNRWDGKEDYICTSIQVPNPYYFDTAKKRNETTLFNDWVILKISPDVINKSSNFCSFNSATGKGRYIESDIEAFKKIFNDKIIKPNSKVITRKPNEYANRPTDIQAEVLIYKQIPKEYITGLVFPNEEIAKVELLRLKLCGVDTSQYKIYFSENYFKKSNGYQKNIEDGASELKVLT